MVSEDGGETWTPPQPSIFKGPCGPLSIKRIPATGDLLAIWNDYDPRWGPHVQVANTYGGRTPLALAISRDEGQTWTGHKILENDVTRGYCYTAIHGVKNAILLAYSCGIEKDGMLKDLCIRKIDVDWLYG
jgi:hypothetical protein